MKKILLSALMVLAVSLTGCGTKDTITVVAREDGSGTRGAFNELFEVEQKGSDGTKKDLTVEDAIIASKTDIMLQNIVSDKNAIGYLSMGSINDTIKTLKIDGVAATSENVKNGSYKAVRAFNIATKGDATGLTKDFIDYILSVEGQSVVGKSYIPANESADNYAGTNLSGKIVVIGSTSVYPLMEKLKEAYMVINPNTVIEVLQNDSTSGLNAAMEGTCDIGMSSRELKDSELAKLKSIKIALDGIAVIVNKNNATDNLTKEQIRSIFTGEVTSWSGVK